MQTTCQTTLIAVALIAATGCAFDGDADLSQGPVGRSEEALILRRISIPRIVTVLQGTGLNGTRLTGQILDGRWVESISLEGATLADGRVEDLRLEGGHFLSGPGRRRIPAGRLVGALVTATLDDGTSLEIRIDDVVRPLERVERGLTRFVVSYPSAAGWQPLCGLDDAGAPIGAHALAGRWDYREGAAGGGAHLDDSGVFTFGCDGFVLAKCAAMGYRPWASLVVCEGRGRLRSCETISLADHHQACTRMLRADYCGDGTSFTEDGVLVNVYDGLGLRVDAEDWPVEAEWDADGARCVVRERLSPESTPTCSGALEVPDCGDAAHFDEGAILFSEVEPW